VTGLVAGIGSGLAALLIAALIELAASTFAEIGVTFGASSLLQTIFITGDNQLEFFETTILAIFGKRVGNNR